MQQQSESEHRPHITRIDQRERGEKEWPPPHRQRPKKKADPSAKGKYLAISERREFLLGFRQSILKG